MSKVLYEAHPSVLRMRPFGVLLALALLAGGILIAVLGKGILSGLPAPLPVVDQLDNQILQMVGIAVFALATLRLLAWWVSARADRLVITEDELIWTHGLLSKEYTEINMASVRTVRVSQSLFQRIVNAGNITVFTAGDNPELFIRGLPDPNEVRELVKAQPQSGV